MSKGKSNRGNSSNYSRPENTRSVRKTTDVKELLTISFKDLDESQPKKSPQSIDSWEKDELLKPLLKRIQALSKLTREEALQQKQIKSYTKDPFPPKTDFTHPNHVDDNVIWSVIKAVGGQKGTVAGYIVESTFYVVFLDKDHRFWISEKKNT